MISNLKIYPMRKIFKIGHLQKFCYSKHKRIPVNPQEAKDFVDVAAEHINARSYLKAKEFLESSLKFENGYAYHHLGYLYEHGYGVNKDLDKSIEFYKKSLELNAPESFLNLAKIYVNLKDFKQGIYYLENSMKHQYKESFYIYLKFIFEKGYNFYHLYKDEHFEETQKEMESLGFKGNTPREISISILKRVLQVANETLKLYKDGESKSIIGQIYYLDSKLNFLGLKNSFETALKYLEEAETDESKALLGKIYLEKEDFAKAKEYFESSNDVHAKALLGEMYLLGQGVEKNYLKGKKLVEDSYSPENAEYIRIMTGLHSLGPQTNLGKIKSMVKEAYEKDPHDLFLQTTRGLNYDCEPAILDKMDDFTIQKAEEILNSSYGEDEFNRKMEYWKEYSTFLEWNQKIFEFEPKWNIKSFGDSRKMSNKVIASFITVCPPCLMNPKKIESISKGENIKEYEKEFNQWKEKELTQKLSQERLDFLQKFEFQILQNMIKVISELQKVGN